MCVECSLLFWRSIYHEAHPRLCRTIDLSDPDLSRCLFYLLKDFAGLLSSVHLRVDVPQI